MREIRRRNLNVGSRVIGQRKEALGSAGSAEMEMQVSPIISLSTLKLHTALSKHLPEKIDASRDHRFQTSGSHRGDIETARRKVNSPDPRADAGQQIKPVVDRREKVRDHRGTIAQKLEQVSAKERVDSAERSIVSDHVRRAESNSENTERASRIVCVRDLAIRSFASELGEERVHFRHA